MSITDLTKLLNLEIENIGIKHADIVAHITNIADIRSAFDAFFNNNAQHHFSAHRLAKFVAYFAAVAYFRRIDDVRSAANGWSVEQIVISGNDTDIANAGT